MKKPANPVMLSEATHLQVFALQKITADASLSMTAHFFTASQSRGSPNESGVIAAFAAVDR